MASSAVGEMSQTMHVLMVCFTIAKLVRSVLGAVYRQIHASEDVDPRDGCITQPLGSVLKSQQRTCLTGWTWQKPPYKGRETARTLASVA